MERRTFLKNLTAIAVVSQIPFVAGKVEEGKYGIEIRKDMEKIMFNAEHIELSFYREMLEVYARCRSAESYVVPAIKGWGLKVEAPTKSYECVFCMAHMETGNLLDLRFNAGNKIFKGSGFVTALEIEPQVFNIDIMGSGKLILIEG